jgi:uncharacterized protein YqeY
MTIKDQLHTALTQAMKSKDETTKRTLRLVLSSIKLAEIESKDGLDDTKIMSIIQKEVKTREDTIEESSYANRQDLVDAAKQEILVLNKFLPKQLEPDELKQLALSAIETTGAKSIRDMGNVMKSLMIQLEGRASGQEASRIVKELLQNR